ncbi:MAG: hypothetical protein H8D42_03665 [Candidatus Marinimicrobia bacterium]|nr:hypothetical protein [Candidatus Neomarinimicrobiota bacterium]
MSDDLITVSLPEEEELRLKQKELESLSDNLAVKELELQELAQEVSRFEFKYYSEVVVRYRMLDEIQAMIAELKFKRKPNDNNRKQEAQEAREKAQATSKEYDEFIASTPEETSQEPPSRELKDLYRLVAKNVHPDKAANEQDRRLREKYMKEANDAYKKGDIEKLKSLLKEYKSAPEAVFGEGAAADLIRTIRIIAQAKVRLAEIDRQIKELKDSEVYVQLNIIKEAEFDGKDYWQVLTKKLDKEIEICQEELNHLVEERV